MPAAVAVPLITGAIGAGTSITGAKMASGAAKRASRVQERSDADAMAFEREREAGARRQWAAEQAFQQQQWAAQEEERAYSRRMLEERDARQAPYRAMSSAALGNLGSMLGLQVPQMTGGPTPSGGGVPAAAMRAPMRPPTSMSEAPEPMGSVGQMTGLVPTRRHRFAPARGSMGDMTGMSRGQGY